MTDAPDLTACMLQRAGDLAHIMLRKGVDVSVANGTTPNGQPCTVITAIGEAAELARRVGEALVRQVEEQRVKERGDAERN